MQMCDKLVFMGGSTNNFPTLDAYWTEYATKPSKYTQFCAQIRILLWLC
jgi:hypothetical protein